MNTDPKIILARVQAGKAKSAAELPGRLEAVQAQSTAAPSSGGGGGLFASVFSSAKNSLAKTMGM
jgi:hypothetical protein